MQTGSYRADGRHRPWNVQSRCQTPRHGESERLGPLSGTSAEGQEAHRAASPGHAKGTSRAGGAIFRGASSGVAAGPVGRRGEAIKAPRVGLAGGPVCEPGGSLRPFRGRASPRVFRNSSGASFPGTRLRAAASSSAHARLDRRCCRERVPVPAVFSLIGLSPRCRQF